MIARTVTGEPLGCWELSRLLSCSSSVPSSLCYTEIQVHTVNLIFTFAYFFEELYTTCWIIWEIFWLGMLKHQSMKITPLFLFIDARMSNSCSFPGEQFVK
jgi:hypothetical protein